MKRLPIPEELKAFKGTLHERATDLVGTKWLPRNVDARHSTIASVWGWRAVG